MKTVALYSLGISDLQLFDLDNNVCPGLKNLRQVCEKIVENINNNGITIKGDKVVLKEKQLVKIDNKEVEIKRLGFPILFAFIDKIKEERGNNPDKIYLFASNQDDPGFRIKDTIILADIIKKVLSINSKFYLKEVIIEEINCKPNDYGLMQCFYKNFFENNPKLRCTTMLYVQATTGTPAMSVNLALSVLNLRHKLMYINESEDRKSSVVRELDYFYKKHVENSIELVEKLLSGMNYQGAIDVMENSPLKTALIERCLIDVLLELRNFNYQGAWEKSLKTSQEDIVDLISELNIPDSNNKYYQLVLNLIEKYQENKQYLEAAVLLAGLYENMRNDFFEKYSGRKIEEFNSFVNEFPDLKEKLAKLNWNGKPNKAVLSKTFKYFSESWGKNSDEYAKFNSLNDKMELVQDWRNKTIFAHGLVGISEEEYNEKVEFIIKETKDLLWPKNKNRDKEYLNFFDIIAERVSSRLREMFL